MPDLWPAGIESNRVTSPVTILREQAALLGQKTKNLVKAEVLIRKTEPGYFSYDFRIVGSSLGDYRYKLFTMFHSISLYPVYLTIDLDLTDEVLAAVANKQTGIGQTYDEDGESNGVSASTEEDFLHVLQLVFGAKKTISIITAILSQADPDWTEIPF
ncbi:hypothetical protein TFLX_02788 [Thermoflexales bacterium]|nr:hypothetical protein TFLX_02788 [Thermoflexales bacterium]